MAQDISIGVIQSPLHWHAPVANREMFSDKIKSLSDEADIIVLPEMFTTGFTMHPADYAEPMDGTTVSWMREMAVLKNAVITGSLIIEEDGGFYNRLIWMKPPGNFQYYDKRHLFAMAGESQHYARGEERKVFDYKGWRICPMICYDLRFPVWARNRQDYDILIYMANWPDKRAYDWKTLLRARAIENQAYTIGVNRIGTDDNGHNYAGDTCVIDAGWMYDLYDAGSREESYVTRLSYEHLREVRSKLPFMIDQDDFDIRP